MKNYELFATTIPGTWKEKLDQLNPKESMTTFYPVEGVRVEVSGMGGSRHYSQNYTKYRLSIYNGFTYNQQPLWVIWNSDNWKEKFIQKVEQTAIEAAKSKEEKEIRSKLREERDEKNKNDLSRLEEIIAGRNQQYKFSLKGKRLDLPTYELGKFVKVSLSNLTVDQQVALFDKVDALVDEFMTSPSRL